MKEWEQSLNQTEARVMLRRFGIHAARHHEDVESLFSLLNALTETVTEQSRIRAQLQAYVKAHWEYLAEILPCDGDCASPNNPCTDTQARACYETNKDSL